MLCNLQLAQPEQGIERKTIEARTKIFTAPNYCFFLFSTCRGGICTILFPPLFTQLRKYLFYCGTIFGNTTTKIETLNKGSVFFQL